MIIDLTHTITPEMPMYPGSAAPSIKPLSLIHISEPTRH